LVEFLLIINDFMFSHTFLLQTLKWSVFSIQLSGKLATSCLTSILSAAT